jgi:hypothetical protein
MASRVWATAKSLLIRFLYSVEHKISIARNCPRGTLSLSSDSWAVGFEEGRPMRRYRLHDAEWDRIKDSCRDVRGMWA